jgi:hypothetical protein
MGVMDAFIFIPFSYFPHAIVDPTVEVEEKTMAFVIG